MAPSVGKCRRFATHLPRSTFADMRVCRIGRIFSGIGVAATRLREAARMHCVLVAALLGLPFFARGADDRVWVSPRGSTAITFNRDLLRDLGLELTSEQPTAPTSKPRSLAFAVDEGAAQIGLAHTESVFVEGVISHQGGVIFSTSGGRSIPVIDFQIRPVPDSALLELCDREGRALFTLDHVQVNHQPSAGRLYLLNMDLRITEYFAQLLDRPELVGIALADLTTELRIGEPVARALESAPPEENGPEALLRTDIELTGLTAVQQMARTAGQRVALSLSTTLRNAGEADVPWFWSIAPAPAYAPVVGPHPYLVLHLYRLVNGVFEQIGRSDVKHAFYATNTGCSRTGGQVFFPGCSDVYGIGNNADQFYFSPRREVTAFTGHWESLGSHFDASPVNNVRDHEDHTDDAFVHRLTVAESALQTPGAQYYVEAWYVVAGDVNLTNSMGYRRVTPKLSGNTWGFTFNSNLTAGPAIDVWAGTEPVSNGTGSSSIVTGEGLVKVASRTTDLGAGNYRYSYALMNVDFDRQIRSFSIPLLPGGGVTTPTFHDGDANTANDWQAVITAEAITWTAPSGSALDWGTLNSFSFLATASPSTAVARFSVLEPGAQDVITAVAARPEPRADLVLSESSAPNPLVNTAQLTYTFTVTNSGPDAASAVVLTNVLPAKAVFVSGSSTQGIFSFQNGLATCALGALPRDGVATVTIAVAPFATGTLANTASVSGAQSDPAPANNLRTAITQLPDTDSDGLPDFFENTNQLDAQNPADAPADLDGDGLTNLQEFETGTNPRNPESVLKIAAVERAANGTTVRFPTVAGRAYRVGFREQLSEGAWATLIDPTVTDASGRIQGDGAIKATHDASAVGRPQRFYRVELLP